MVKGGSTAERGKAAPLTLQVVRNGVPGRKSLTLENLETDPSKRGASIPRGRKTIGSSTY